jgi:hypothetical protein
MSTVRSCHMQCKKPTYVCALANSLENVHGIACNARTYGIYICDIPGSVCRYRRQDDPGYFQVVINRICAVPWEYSAAGGADIYVVRLQQ